MLNDPDSQTSGRAVNETVVNGATCGDVIWVGAYQARDVWPDAAIRLRVRDGFNGHVEILAPLTLKEAEALALGLHEAILAAIKLHGDHRK